MTTTEHGIEIVKEEGVYRWSIGDKGGYCATFADAVNDACIAAGIPKIKLPSRKAMALLLDQFDKGSGVHTDRGTAPIWGQLFGAGYVKHLPRLGFGHLFEYEITPLGRAALNAFKEQAA